MIAGAEFNLDRPASNPIAGQEAIHIQRGIGAQHILWLREDVVDVSCGNNAQRDLAVDSAEGHVIDFITERRNVRTFRRIDLENQHVLRILVQMLGQFKGEWCEAALVLAQ